MNAHDDDRLRSLFDDAVADVEPRGGLDTIQARTATRTRRPWVWGAGGAVLATAATVRRARDPALGRRPSRPTSRHRPPRHPAAPP